LRASGNGTTPFVTGIAALQAYAICALLDPITPGALAGYNFQFGNIVTGVEGDAGWIGRHSPIIWAPDGSLRYDQYGVTWTGHVRGRVGYAVGQYLPYFAGGLAFAGYNVAHYHSDATGSVLYSTNDIRVGYTIGGGLEIANLFQSLLPGWTLRGEYLYDHFNPTQYDWVPGMRYTVLDLTIHTVRAAATYRFSPRAAVLSK
jgi:outer membrane immunogenic protein